MNMETKRPNILFIVADDLNTRQGCYGDLEAHTPNLDELASEGVIFDRAYAAGSVCTPSRKSFLTGLKIYKVGRGNNNFMKENPETMTMPRWFRENGYQTAKIGKIEHTDDYEGPKCWTNKLIADPVSYEGVVRRNFKNLSGDMLGFANIFPDTLPTPDHTRVNGFKDFITSKWDKTKPFFFALGFHTPHVPWNAQKRHFDMHPLERMPLSKTPEGATLMSKPPKYIQKILNDLHGIKEDADQKSIADVPPEKQVEESVQRKIIQSYYAAVSMMDELIGDVRQFLKDQGLEEDTIVVFTSDQGYFLGYRGLFSKHYVYPEVLRVPLIIKYPKLAAPGKRAEGIVELMDLFPTLTEMAGLPIPSGLDGKSFVELLKNPYLEGKEAAYAEGIMFGCKAVTTKEHTYLQWDESDLMIPSGRRALETDIGIALKGLIDGTRIKNLKIEVEEEQRWINFEGHIEASREFYNLEKDPQAWFNVAEDDEYKNERQMCEELLKAMNTGLLIAK